MKRKLTSALTNQAAKLILLETQWTGFITRQFRASLTATGITAMLVFTEGETERFISSTRTIYITIKTRQ